MTTNTTVISTTKRSQPGMQAITWGRVGRMIPPVLGVIWLVIGFYPVLFILLTSLRSQAGFFTESPWLPTSHPTLSNYTDVLNNGFALDVVNSVFVTVISIVLIVIVSLLAAYAISRVRSRFVAVVFSLFLLGLAIPLQATIIPLYVIINGMGLYDSLYALILPYVAFGIPLSVLILVTYIRDIPQSLFESMLLDGASNLQILRRLVIPLSRPALITVVIYQCIQVWNGFLFPLVLTQSPEVRVLPLALWSFQGQYGSNIPAIMAAVFLSAVPIILLYIFGRRQLLSGLTAGFSK
jgi:raffinose/stachyose/melibiose transport system permease protein